VSRTCDWCKGPIPTRARKDAETCGVKCRQMRHDFTRGLRLPGANGEPIRVAYADPPYPGLAHRYYKDHPDYAGEVDHAALFTRLAADFPDGWALSTSAKVLRSVLALSPAGTMVAAWVRGERPVRSLRPLSAWEPVLYCGGRSMLLEPNERRTDTLVHFSRPRLGDPQRVIGQKPAAFAGWLFRLLGLRPGDELVDLFPGSGGIARAWAYACRPGGADPSSSAASDGSGSARADASAVDEVLPDVSARGSTDASVTPAAPVGRVLPDASAEAFGDGSAACVPDGCEEAPDGWVSRKGDPGCWRCGHKADDHSAFTAPDADQRPWCVTCWRGSRDDGPCPRYVGPPAVCRRDASAGDGLRVGARGPTARRAT
jgi:hypothetical protein